jgi:hypothetical protein
MKSVDRFHLPCTLGPRSYRAGSARPSTAFLKLRRHLSSAGRLSNWLCRIPASGILREWSRSPHDHRQSALGGSSAGYAEDEGQALIKPGFVRAARLEGKKGNKSPRRSSPMRIRFRTAVLSILAAAGTCIPAHAQPPPGRPSNPNLPAPGA